MKETIALLMIYLGATVATVAFWVWLGTLLVWKIFTIAGAASFIYPAFWIMCKGPC
ncbi:hypothetical protein [Lactococcus garvieae]|uniref:Uncharacterized protein n=1 Tax=Lactococcus garvieae DCC43 TaxID=1231377 RepID=K2NS23_9LACT|nr:hypothetical protein [Lactococcus garvieae]EKF50388.1 hypothetical protein C426_2262 [Lactococcus garvieae DCC43]